MTSVDVCNMALAMLGHDRTISAIDNATAEGRRCSLFYAPARKTVLAAHDWGWLAKVEELAGGTPYIVTDGVNPYSESPMYAYQRPATALKIIGFFKPNMDGVPARCEAQNGELVSDLDEVIIRYVPDQTDPDAWPQAVADAIVAELAARLALPMAGKVETSRAMRQEAIRALAMARAADSNETAHHGMTGNRYADARK